MMGEDQKPDDSNDSLFESRANAVEEEPNDNDSLFDQTITAGKNENKQKQNQNDYLNMQGAGLGAAAAGAGNVVRQGLSGTKSVVTDILRDALGPQAQANASGNSSGQKWFGEVINKDGNGYTAPEGDVGVKEAAQSYQRQKSHGKITSKLEKKFGKSTPGRLSIQGNAAFSKTPEPIVEHSFWNTPGGKLVSTAGHGLKSLAGDIAHGALHGLNAAQQGAQAIMAPDKVSGTLHGGSALGSVMDIASNIAPQEARAGLRQLGGPLATLGATLGEGYDIYKNKNYEDIPAAGVAGVASTIPVIGLPLSMLIRHMNEKFKDLDLPPDQKAELIRKAIAAGVAMP